MTNDVEREIYQLMQGLACGKGYHGWAPIDINWPLCKTMRWLDRRFTDQGKRVWGGIQTILQSYTKEERAVSEHRFIRNWP